VTGSPDGVDCSPEAGECAYAAPMATTKTTKTTAAAPPAAAAKPPRRNLNRPEGGWAGESGADRRAAGQKRWEAWLNEAEDAGAKAKAEAWGLSKSDLVREALALLPAKPK
jgi:hypothetical protein